jgi:hypothetical protein
MNFNHHDVANVPAPQLAIIILPRRGGGGVTGNFVFRTRGCVCRGGGHGG